MPADESTKKVTSQENEMAILEEQIASVTQLNQNLVEAAKLQTIFADSEKNIQTHLTDLAACVQKAHEANRNVCIQEKRPEAYNQLEADVNACLKYVDDIDLTRTTPQEFQRDLEVKYPSIFKNASEDKDTSSSKQEIVTNSPSRGYLEGARSMAYQSGVYLWDTSVAISQASKDFVIGKAATDNIISKGKEFFRTLITKKIYLINLKKDIVRLKTCIDKSVDLKQLIEAADLTFFEKLQGFSKLINSLEQSAITREYKNKLRDKLIAAVTRQEGIIKSLEQNIQALEKANPHTVDEIAQRKLTLTTYQQTLDAIFDTISPSLSTEEISELPSRKNLDKDMNSDIFIREFNEKIAGLEQKINEIQPIFDSLLEQLSIIKDLEKNSTQQAELHERLAAIDEELKTAKDENKITALGNEKEEILTSLLENTLIYNSVAKLTQTEKNLKSQKIAIQTTVNNQKGIIQTRVWNTAWSLALNVATEVVGKAEESFSKVIGDSLVVPYTLNKKIFLNMFTTTIDNYKNCKDQRDELTGDISAYIESPKKSIFHSYTNNVKRMKDILTGKLNNTINFLKTANVFDKDPQKKISARNLLFDAGVPEVILQTEYQITSLKDRVDALQQQIAEKEKANAPIEVPEIYKPGFFARNKGKILVGGSAALLGAGFGAFLGFFLIPFTFGASVPVGALIGAALGSTIITFLIGLATGACIDQKLEQRRQVAEQQQDAAASASSSPRSSTHTSINATFMTTPVPISPSVSATSSPAGSPDLHESNVASVGISSNASLFENIQKTLIQFEKALAAKLGLNGQINTISPEQFIKTFGNQKANESVMIDAARELLTDKNFKFGSLTGASKTSFGSKGYLFAVIEEVKKQQAAQLNVNTKYGNQN